MLELTKVELLPFLFKLFFLHGLLYAKIKNKKSYLNDRQKEVLQFVQNNEPVKISDVTSALKGYTPYTLRKDIKYLTEEGVIKKLGKARATIYVMNELKK